MTILITTYLVRLKVRKKSMFLYLIFMLDVLCLIYYTLCNNDIHILLLIFLNNIILEITFIQKYELRYNMIYYIGTNKFYTGYQVLIMVLTFK